MTGLLEVPKPIHKGGMNRVVKVYMYNRAK